MTLQHQKGKYGKKKKAKISLILRDPKWIFQFVTQAASHSRLTVFPGQGEQTARGHEQR